MATLVFVLTAAGCGTAAGARALDNASPTHSPADVQFMRHMIPHHAQALVMIDLVPARAGSDRIRMLARRIEVSQQDEIAMMEGWLRDRGEHVPDIAAHHEHAPMADATEMMPGMLTAEQLDRLASASGPEFDRLFLEFMIQHHEGALVMVSELFGTPGAAQEAVTYQIASEIDADQETEIARMRAMLETLSPQQ
jgi:uncharacterized protein (DUF305 family)